jgi:hypothetical protein
MVRGPVIELATADVANARESFRKSATSSITNGWSNLAYPGPGTNYLVVGKTLRSPDQVKVNGANVRAFAFEGDSLTLKDGATLAVRSHALTNDNLYCMAGNSDVVISHYSGGSTALFPYSKSGTSIFAGRCEFSSSASKWVVLSLSTDRGFRYDAEFAGDANVRVQGYCESTQKNPPKGAIQLQRQQHVDGRRRQRGRAEHGILQPGVLHRPAQLRRATRLVREACHADRRLYDHPSDERHRV